MTLYLSQKKLLVLLLLALAMGFALGFLYDGLRLLRTVRRPKKRFFRLLNLLVISLEDFLFFVFSGAAMSILFYVINSGKVRPAAFVMAILGFWLFRVTLSRVTYPLFLFLLHGIGRLLAILIISPLCVALRVVRRIFNCVALFFARRFYKRFLVKLAHLGEKGYRFGIRHL